MKHVLILFGGTSSEHDVSINSAQSVYENIDKNLFEISLCYISKNNVWYKFDGNFNVLRKNDWLDNHDDDSIFNIIKYLKSFDVIFPVLHGRGGEDGKLQGMLELFEIPFVGCGCLASNLGMDKIISKIIFEKNGIPTLPCISIDIDDYMIEDIIYHLDFPMIVKPANGGSSIGITKVDNVKELDTAIKDASQFDRYILIEPFIVGQELECAILENNGLIASTIGEITPTNTFYDYEAKYISSSPQTEIPANIPDTVAKEIQTYAKMAFKAIRGANLARVDFFYETKSQKIYLNEINALPGFTEISMYPKMLSYDKISYSELLTTLIENTKERRD